MVYFEKFETLVVGGYTKTILSCSRGKLSFGTAFSLCRGVEPEGMTRSAVCQ